MRATLITVTMLGMVPSLAWADAECKSYDRSGEEVQRYTDDAISTISGCGTVNIDRVDGIFWLDRPGKPVSEIARVFHVKTCLSPTAENLIPSLWLMCGFDATRMNRAAYDAEVAKLKLSPERKAKFGPYFETTAASVKNAQAVVAARTGDEAAYKQALEAADKEFKAWDSFYAENKALIDATTAVEDKWWAINAIKRSAVNDLGCEDVRAGWKAWVKDKKLTSAKQLPDAVKSNELATIVVRTLAICDAAANRNVDGKTEAEMLDKSFTFRGPRMHAVWSSMTTLSQLLPENLVPDMTPILVADPLRKLANDRADWWVDGWSHPKQAKISAIKKVDGGVELTFKKETWMEPDFECYDLPTRWWSQVDGRYKHDFACKKVGQHPESTEENPTIFSAWAADGLKVGQVVTWRSGSNKAEKKVGFALESRTPEKGAAKAAKAKKGKDDQVKKGVELQTTGTLEVLYGVALK